MFKYNYIRKKKKVNYLIRK